MITVITFIIAIALFVVVVALLRRYVLVVRPYRAAVRRAQMKSRLHSGLGIGDGSLNRITYFTTDPETQGVVDTTYRKGYFDALNDTFQVIKWAKDNAVAVGVMDDDTLGLRYVNIIFAKIPLESGKLLVFKVGANKWIKARSFDDLNAALDLMKQMRAHFAPGNENPFDN